MSENFHEASFDKAIKDFASSLRRRHVEDFRVTTFDRLMTSIANLQATQHAQRRLQDLTRLEPFVEAIQQYEKLVSTFYRNNDLTAFIWGPLMFLLQVVSINDTAFGEVMNAYKQMGETLPLLVQYQELFRDKPHMIRVLAFMYEGILDLQRIILRYFQQPQWQKVFSESWTTCKSRFSRIFRDIAQHRSLIESQASSAQIEETRETIQQSRQAEDHQIDEQNERRFGEIRNWLRPADMGYDQAKFVNIRAEYPGTGQWLLENAIFKKWFDPQYAKIPPLLWLNGIPGAGKTILASLVVQRAKELKHAPNVLYFYCKNDNSERNNFVAIGRSLLAQFLLHDNGLLPTFFQQYCRSGETILSSQTIVDELLTLAFKNCRSAYIILDGLDECPRDQRKYIVNWFRRLVENLPNDQADRLRCLFISQDDGAARKDFYGLASMKITAKDTQDDISKYCRIQAEKLTQSNSFLPNEKAAWIATTVANLGGTSFLIAKLLWDKVSSHTSIARMEEELQPNVHHEGVNDAYRRIMTRLNDETTQVARKDTTKLLCWLVCAKRPFKWHEIQVMNSINREERHVALERQSFVKSPKDLLASLVETCADGTLEFCHPVGQALFGRGRVAALHGEYGFMDYAVLFWVQHLEAGMNLETGEETELTKELAESLEIFIHQHWNPPTMPLILAKHRNDKLQRFETLNFYNHLEQAVASTKLQLKQSGESMTVDNATNLARIVRDVRKLLESIIMDDPGHISQQTIVRRYGINMFKCSRFSCAFFTEGFSTALERDKHISKHERPIKCPDETCVGYTFGFSESAEREKHMRESHFEMALPDDDFPTQEDMDRSISRNQPAAESSRVSNPLKRINSVEDVTLTAREEPPSESEAEPQYQHRSKRARQTEFKCPHCNAVYKKRYNLQSHLLSHDPERAHVCEVCSLSFARPTDLRRHMDKHTGDKSFVCFGTLRNGDTWGCGKSFARADTLKKHQESGVGRTCIQPLLQEGDDLMDTSA